MKIFLRSGKQWKLYEGTANKLQVEFDKRNITLEYPSFIQDNVSIEDGVMVGCHTWVGQHTILGEGVILGRHVMVGHHTILDNHIIVEDRCNIGDLCFIGYKTKIKRNVYIASHVIIERFVNIEESSTLEARSYICSNTILEKNSYIGIASKISDPIIVKEGFLVRDGFDQKGKDAFTELDVLLRTGILLQKGKGIFYKCVLQDLIDLENAEYHYKEGGGDQVEAISREVFNNLEKNRSVKTFSFSGFPKALQVLNRRDGCAIKHLPRTDCVIISVEIDIKNIVGYKNLSSIYTNAYSDVRIVDILFA